MVNLKTKIALAACSALLLGVYFLYDNAQPLTYKQSAKYREAKTPVASESPKPQVAPVPPPQTLTKPNKESETVSFANQDEFLAAVKAVDLWSQVDLTGLVTRLRATDSETTAQWFIQSYELQKLNIAERDRLISVAEVYGGEAMLGFWRKVLVNETGSPVTIDEHGHRDVLATQELHKGIQAVRILAASNTEAREFLGALVTDKNVHQDDPLLRKLSLLALKEVDPNASMRILRTLGDEELQRIDAVEHETVK